MFMRTAVPAPKVVDHTCIYLCKGLYVDFGFPGIHRNNTCPLILAKFFVFQLMFLAFRLFFDMHARSNYGIFNWDEFICK